MQNNRPTDHSWQRKDQVKVIERVLKGQIEATFKCVDLAADLGLPSRS